MTEEQYERIKDALPVQRGNVRLSNLQVLNAVLYVSEQGCINGSMMANLEQSTFTPVAMLRASI